MQNSMKKSVPDSSPLSTDSTLFCTLLFIAITCLGRVVGAATKLILFIYLFMILGNGGYNLDIRMSF
jgi:hypothetical protein